MLRRFNPILVLFLTFVFVMGIVSIGYASAIDANNMQVASQQAKGIQGSGHGDSGDKGGDKGGGKGDGKGHSGHQGHHGHHGGHHGHHGGCHPDPKPNPTPAPTPAPKTNNSSTPFLQLKLPLATDAFAPGAKANILWAYWGDVGSTATLYLMKDNARVATIASDVLIYKTSYTWNVPGKILPGTYRIQMVTTGSKRLETLSEPFKIK